MAKSNAIISLPPAKVVIIPLIFSPRPVILIVPIIIPAHIQAEAMGAIPAAASFRDF
jgi:hypothetical protein